MDLDAAGMVAALEKAEHHEIARYRMNAMDEARSAIAAAGSLADAVANRGKPGK